MCVMHGAGTAKAKAAAKRRLEEQRVASETSKLLAEMTAAAKLEQPFESIEDARARATAMARILADAVDEVDFLGDETDMGGRPTVRAEMLAKWTDMQMRAGKLASDAGIDERRTVILEAEAEALVGVLSGVTDALLAVVVGLLESSAPDAVPGVRDRWAAELPVIVAREIDAVTS